MTNEIKRGPHLSCDGEAAIVKGMMPAHSESRENISRMGNGCKRRGLKLLGVNHATGDGVVTRVATPFLLQDTVEIEMGVGVSDEELIRQIEEYMKENPGASRHMIAIALGTSTPRLKRLYNEGVSILPPALSRSASASKGAKRSPWRKFRLRGSPTTREQA
jgi:hypothetical protein